MGVYIVDKSGKRAKVAGNVVGVTSFNERAGEVSPEAGDYTADMVGARPDTWVPTADEVGARPDTWTPTASEVGARPDTWMPTAVDVGALPVSGGTITGDIRIKGSSSYGTKINLGDGDYVHISEPTDDNMEIKGKTINFVTSNSPGLLLNGSTLVQFGTSDLIAGTSNLATGTIYLVYE